MEPIDQLYHLHVPRWEELPKLDLYMDQVLFFLNDSLDCLNDSPDKPLLTSSMVNNYVKTSIVRPPVKKHYKNYHLAYLIVVVLMKQCFSLSEISQCIEIYSDIESPERIAADYNRFVTAFENSLKEYLEKGSCSFVIYEDPNPQQELMSLVIQTIAAKACTSCRLRAIAKNDKQ